MNEDKQMQTLWQKVELRKNFSNAMSTQQSGYASSKKKLLIK